MTDDEKVFYNVLRGILEGLNRIADSLDEMKSAKSGKSEPKVPKVPKVPKKPSAKRKCRRKFIEID